MRIGPVSLRRVRVSAWATILALAAAQAFSARHAMNADGIAYIEVGEAYLAGDWESALNGYWSPLYSWLLAGALRVLPVSSYWEATVAHGVNLVLVVPLLVCAEYLFRSLHPPGRGDDTGYEGGRHATVALRVYGYAITGWVTLDLLRLEPITPDILVVALTCLAAGITARIVRRGPTPGRGAGLGAVLGLGFLTKAIFGPLTVVFLGIVLVAGRARLRRALATVGVAAGLWLAVAGPFAVALSIHRGEVEIGDAGRLNYAWYVTDARRWIHWQGDGEHDGTPVHPTRRLLDEPEAFSFAAPFEVTYPPWYDPSYWYQGLDLEFDAGNQLSTVLRHLALFGKTFDWLGILALVVLLAGPAAWARLWREGFPILVPGLAGLGAYALVHAEGRLVAPFVLLVALSLALGLPRVSNGEEGTGEPWERWLLLAVSLLALAKAVDATAELRGSHPDGHRSWHRARALQDLGLPPGAPIAVVGGGFDAYWARLADLRIVAEVPRRSAAEFWSSSDEERSRVYRAFSGVGARAVVVTDPPESVALPDEWRQLHGLAARRLGSSGPAPTNRRRERSPRPGSP